VLTNERYDRLHFLGRGVRQIDPQEIHASAVKSLDYIAVQRCRAEGAKNLDLHEPEILDGRVRKNDRRIFSGTKKPLQAAEIKDITALSVRTSSFQGIRPQGVSNDSAGVGPITPPPEVKDVPRNAVSTAFRSLSSLTLRLRVLDRR
jgi:hypothetical protein